MIFTVERNQLLSALTRINGAVARRSTIPIISNVLIVAGVDNVTFRATNLDMEATTTIKANVETGGQTCVDADRLLTIAKGAADGSDIRADLAERLTIKSGRSRFVLATLSPDDFPTFGAMEKGVSFDLDVGTASDLFGRCAYAMSTEASRFVLTGLYVFHEQGNLGVVATNTHRMALIEEPFDGPDFTALVPAPMVAEIRKLAGYGDLTVAVAPGKIKATCGETSVISKLIDGEYIAFRRGIPKEVPHTFTADREALIAAIRRVEVGLDPSDRVVRLIVEDGMIKVGARSAEAEAGDELEAEYDGAALNFCVNPEYLIDALSEARGESVAISCGDPKRAFTVVGVGGDVMFASMGTRAA